MKKVMMIFTLSMIAFISQAQEDKTITSISLQVNNSYQWPSSNRIQDFYGLGGQINVFFKEKFYLGFSQLGSLAPSDLSTGNELSPDKIRLYEYALNFGLKSDLGSNLYLMTGLRGGLGLISLGAPQRIDGFNEFISKEKTESYFVAPELKLGVQLHKNFAIEAGATYKKYFGDNEKWGVAPKDFDGFAATLSLVGRLPFD